MEAFEISTVGNLKRWKSKNSNFEIKNFRELTYSQSKT